MDKGSENGLLNVRKTAQLLDVHPNTLRNWTNQGLLPCYTLNSRGDRRFRRRDIEDFLARHRRMELQPENIEPDSRDNAKTVGEMTADQFSAAPLEVCAVPTTEL